jgi:hypothetical protein
LALVAQAVEFQPSAAMVAIRFLIRLLLLAAVALVEMTTQCRSLTDRQAVLVAVVGAAVLADQQAAPVLSTKVL